HDLGSDLLVELTGTFDIILQTQDQRLNAEVTAGAPSELALLVGNPGTAPLTAVSLDATAPSGWEVTFAPESIDAIPPGETAQVTAAITPSPEAVAGDYRITFRSSVDQATDTIEIRATVSPSALWGLVGVGVIALTLAGLAMVFRRFGRR
ncbi:MAG: NEW3 domain-containing protein, partial [Acidimicrobiia bacterium]